MREVFLIRVEASEWFARSPMHLFERGKANRSRIHLGAFPFIPTVLQLLTKLVIITLLFCILNSSDHR